MPNWCSNYIEISGSKDAIRLITDKIKNSTEKNNLFKTLIGYADGVTDENYESVWYDHNHKRYGTKWDVEINIDNISFYDDAVFINTETAWTPPIEFCTNLAKMYDVNVTIEYNESLGDFAGKVICDSSGITDESFYPYMEGLYRYDDDLFWNDVRYLFENNPEPLDYYKKEYSFLDEEGMDQLDELYTLLTDK